MIRIFQMHCNFSELSKDKQRPEWFIREKIFDSFIRTLNSSVSYLAVHDSGNGKIEDHFINNKDVEKISMVGGNGAKAFLNLLNYVKEQKFHEDDIIYFVEDDYLHKKRWIDILREGFDLINADYYTLYDHPDKYLDPRNGGNPYCEGGAEDTRVYLTDSCHWKMTNSTTMTLAAKVSTLKRVEPILRKWTSETHPNDFQMFIELRNQGELLITPIPGYATHGETAWLSPLTDWSKI